jgi:GTP cyclohydrolase-4
MFVEDIVREISYRAFHKYRDLPDEAVLSVSSESEESIHPHNAYARVSVTIGELEKIIGKK